MSSELLNSVDNARRRMTQLPLEDEEWRRDIELARAYALVIDPSHDHELPTKSHKLRLGVLTQWFNKYAAEPVVVDGYRLPPRGAYPYDMWFDLVDAYNQGGWERILNAKRPLPGYYPIGWRYDEYHEFCTHLRRPRCATRASLFLAELVDKHVITRVRFNDARWILMGITGDHGTLDTFAEYEWA